jgi:DUF4097 and DUF4098 domain-containing protein YvlB
MNLFTYKSIGVFALVLAAGVAGAQTITKNFTGVKNIRLTTSSGDVLLAKGGSQEVQVEVSSTYDKSDYQPVFEQSGSTLTLKENFDRRSVSGHSTWKLTIPDGLDLHITSGSGNMEAADLKFTAKMNTGSGDYSWRNITGESSINTGSGKIELDAYQGDLRLNSGSGDIRISKSQGDLHANTGSGDISISGTRGGVFANTGSGDIRAQEVALTSKGMFNSGSGKVLLVLSAPLTADLSLNSGSGDAVLDCKGTALEGKVIMTASKKNGDIVAPFAFDKTEEINEGNHGDATIRKTVQLGSSTRVIKISTGSGTAEVRK